MVKGVQERMDCWWILAAAEMLVMAGDPSDGGEGGQVRASSRLANLYLQGQRLSMSWMGMISSEGRSDDSSSRTCEGRLT